jgi:hypothetical protein
VVRVAVDEPLFQGCLVGLSNKKDRKAWVVSVVDHKNDLFRGGNWAR